ncbi:platelet-activating factor acetylhydrolase 2, cytoplasmic-like [Erpetoichthys calabaricus]|uniref:Platelet-activating factor acetylhydrolase n=1 Tax=Erpetoichthys calabaricus TaxID=27687 RepID=A0A8C4XD66_ERPCA|nr:platelet-activating factor acetylhydrolase 2, cytoplasmic-like [Erpetoichthys calabaricus]
MGNRSSLGLPTGSGPHLVGCADIMADHTRKGTFFRLYYPCQAAEDSEQPLWIPRSEYCNGLADYMNLNKNWFTPLLKLTFGSFQVPVRWCAPVVPGLKFPLLIFSHGLGAFRTVYAAVCLEMASHGFLVAALEHRDCSASITYHYKETSSLSTEDSVLPNCYLQEEWINYRKIKQEEKEFKVRNLQLHQRANECVRALNFVNKINDGRSIVNVMKSDFDIESLKNRVDMEKVGVIGHSFGGATSLLALLKDDRFRCAIALDAWMFPIENNLYFQMRKPAFFINTETFQTTDSIAKMKKLFQNNKETKMITILGTVHQSHSDFTFLISPWLSRIYETRGKLQPERALEITARAAMAFLNRHLDINEEFNSWGNLVEGKGTDIIPDAPPVLSNL